MLRPYGIELRQGTTAFVELPVARRAGKSKEPAGTPARRKTNAYVTLEVEMADGEVKSLGSEDPSYMNPHSHQRALIVFSVFGFFMFGLVVVNVVEGEAVGYFDFVGFEFGAEAFVG